MHFGNDVAGRVKSLEKKRPDLLEKVGKDDEKVLQ